MSLRHTATILQLSSLVLTYNLVTLEFNLHTIKNTYIGYVPKPLKQWEACHKEVGILEKTNRQGTSKKDGVAQNSKN